MPIKTNEKKKQNVTRGNIDALGRRIISGQIIPQKTILFEQDLIEEFGASRNAVREAVKTLAGKNLVVSARKKGTMVRPPEEWNLLDPSVMNWMISDSGTSEMLIDALSELRQIVEPEAAALAAERANSTQILKLFECYAQMVANIENSKLAVHWDTEFHKVLLEASCNPLLRSLANSFGQLLHSNFTLFTNANKGFIRNLIDHKLIAEAIRDRNPQLARERSKFLLQKNESDIKELKTDLKNVVLPNSTSST